MLTTSQKSTKLFKSHLGVSDTKENREFFEEPLKSGFVVTPNMLWMYGDKVPNGSTVSGGSEAVAAIKALSKANPVYSWQKDEATVIPVVKKHTLIPLTQIDGGTHCSFVLVDSEGNQVRNIIPFNFYDTLYNYHLYRADGVEIPFGVGDWLFDCYSGVLTFYGDLPSGVSALQPPIITCFQYVGGNGFRQDAQGMDGAILPINNFKIAAGEFSTPGTETNLQVAITSQCDKIKKDFVSIYGWDGADDNEGVALSFEKVLPLTYTASKDPVKGYDDSQDCEIGATISRVKASIAECKAVITTYADNVMPTGVELPTNKILIEVGLAAGQTAPSAVAALIQSFVDHGGYEGYYYHIKLIGFDGVGTNPYVPYSTVTPAGASPELATAIAYWKSIIDTLKLDVKIILDISESKLTDEKLTSEMLGAATEADLLALYGLILPSTTQSLGDGTLAYASNLEILDIGESVSYLGEKAISGKVKRVIFPVSLTHLNRKGVFGHTPSLEEIFIKSKTAPIFGEGEGASFVESSSGDLFSEGVPSTLAVYVYDSIRDDFVATPPWNTLTWSSQILKLSANKDFPLLTGEEYKDAPALFSVAYINEKADVSGDTTFKIRFEKKGTDLYALLIVNDVRGPSTLVQGPLVRIAALDGSTVMVVNVGTTSSTTLATITLAKDAPYIGLFYWSIPNGRYEPFIPKETSYYDFGFPVTTLAGKIPPSISLGSSALSDFSDAITPDYYGPRIFSVVIGTEEGGDQLKSVDYTVKNTTGFFLDDILEAIKKSASPFSGTIFLRKGKYRLQNPYTLVGFGNITLAGEGPLLTTIVGSLSVGAAQEGYATIQGIAIEGSLSINNSESPIIGVADLVVSEDITLSKASDANGMFVRNVQARNISLSQTSALNPSLVGSSEYKVRIADSRCVSLSCAADEANVVGVTSQKASFTGGKTTVTGSAFLQVAAKAHGTLLKNCDVRSFASTVEITERENDGSFEMWVESGGELYHRFTSFANPFYWNRDEHQIVLKIDTEVLSIDNQGRLTTCIMANRIGLHPEDYARDSNAIDPVTGKVVPVTATTLEEALVDLYKNKADLIGGKVPLKQLPDSVAYGGLEYIGTWSIEDHGGAYPTLNELKQLGYIDVTAADYIDALQPGWFVIITPPKSETSKDKSDDSYNPAKDQVASDGVVYTAGDWSVCNGNGGWEKVDRAYQDAAYAILPALDPDGKDWDWRRLGDGFLNFEKATITEAFDKINELFVKLVPRKPCLLPRAKLELKNGAPVETFYKISAAGVGSPIQLYNLRDHPTMKRPIVGTPEGSTWKDMIYFGDTATLVGYLNGTLLDTLTLDSSSKATSVKGKSVEAVIKDPFADEIMGQDMWKAANLRIATQEDLVDGTYQYILALGNTTPNRIADGQASLSFGLMTPYDLSEAAVSGAEQPALGTLALAGRCSGIPMLKTPFNMTVRATVSRAAKSYVFDPKFVKVFGKLYDKVDPAFSIFADAQGDNSYVTITLAGSVVIDTDLVETEIDSTVKILGATEDITKEFSLFNLTKYRIDPTTESERLFSGEPTKLFPSWQPTVNLGCGSPYLSSKNLLDWPGELMKMGRNVGAVGSQKCTSEFQWPAGKHYVSSSETLDYDSCAGSTIAGLIGEYRFVTLRSFLQEGILAPVVLDNASGFLARIEVEADQETLWDTAEDDLTGKTSGLTLHFMVIGADGVPVTGWLDANSPYDGYSSPSSNGDAAMYAGSSSAREKRVTFGRIVRSGTLVARAGITKTSSFKFKGISIASII